MNGSSLAAHPPAGNFFAATDYIKWDMGRGVLRARGGARLMAFPQEFTVGLLAGLEDECGEAWPIVMYRCGEWWGKRHMERMEKDLGAHYREELRDLPTAHAHSSLTEAWALHGWGRISFDMADIEHGVMHVHVDGSQIAAAFMASGKDPKGKPVCSLLSGIMAGLFSHMTKAEIVAHEVSCVARKEDACRFVMGQKEKVAGVPDMIRKRATVEEIGQKLKGGG